MMSVLRRSINLVNEYSIEKFFRESVYPDLKENLKVVPSKISFSMLSVIPVLNQTWLIYCFVIVVRKLHQRKSIAVINVTGLFVPITNT